MNLPQPKLPDGLKRLFTMSASVLSFPRRNRENAARMEPGSLGAGISPGRRLPQPRPMSHWMLIAFLAALALALCWLGYAGYKLHAATVAQHHISMNVPDFEAYLASRPLPPEVRKAQEAKKKQHATKATDAHAAKATDAHAPKKAANVEPRELIEHAFANFAQFENGRAEFPLRKHEAVVTNVQPGSPAQVAGIVAGDLITAVNGKPAGFLWDVFVQLSAKPASTAELEIKRGDAASVAILKAPANSTIDAGNSGLLFDLPENLHYMGPNDVVELARQFSNRFLDSVPTEWRKEYAGNVDLYSQQLSQRITEQSTMKPEDPLYLRVDQMLVWHHETFMQAVERHSSEERDAENQVGAALDRLGSAVLATALALLLTLAAGVVGGMSLVRRGH